MYIFASQFSYSICLKQGAALLPLLFNFALKYSNQKVQDDQEELKLNGAHQLLLYADVILLGDNIHTAKEDILCIKEYMPTILISDLYVILTSNLLWHSHINGDTLCIMVGKLAVKLYLWRSIVRHLCHDLVYTCCHAFNYKSSLICKEGLTCL
jgi:hypothetical protein